VHIAEHHDTQGPMTTVISRRLSNRRRATAPLFVRALIWVMLVGVLGGGYASISTIETSNPTPAQAASTQPVAAPTAPEMHTGLLADDATTLSDGDNRADDYNERPLSLLPAYRWKDSASFMNNLGTGDIASGTTGVGLIASFVFVLGSFLWTITLALVAFADTADFLAVAGSAVNSTVHTLVNAIWPLIGLAYVFMLLRLTKELIRGNYAAFFRGLLAFMVPISVLYTLGTSTAGPAATTSPATTAGTPAWMATKAVDTIDTSGAALAAAFDPLTFDTSSLNIDGNDNMYHCSRYMGVLESSYTKYAEGSDNGGPAMFASKLWVLAMYEPWSIAAFGDTSFRHAATCQWREKSAEVPWQERQELSQLAYGVDFNKTVFTNSSQSFGEGQWSQDTWALSLWQACRPGDVMQGKVGDDGFGWSQTMDKTHEWDQAKSNEHCKSWRVDGRDDLDSAMESLFDRQDDIASVEVKNWFKANTGHNAMDRLMLSFVALFGAMAYLFALAGASIGLILGKIGLVLGAMMLPITLTMIGLKIPAGAKLLRWTASMCALDLVFTLLLGALFQITLVGQTVIAAGTGANGAAGSGAVPAAFGSGYAGMLLSAMVPVLAVLLLSKVLKTVGLGSITNPFKAAGLVSRTSAKALGSQSTGEFVKGSAKNSMADGAKKAGRAKRAIDAAKGLKDHGSGFDAARKKAAKAAAAAHKAAGGDEARREDPEGYNKKLAAFLKDGRGKGAMKDLEQFNLAMTQKNARREMLKSGNVLGLWKDMQGKGAGGAALDTVMLAAGIGVAPGATSPLDTAAFVKGIQSNYAAGEIGDGGTASADVTRQLTQSAEQRVAGIEEPVLRADARNAVVADQRAEFAAACGLPGELPPDALAAIAGLAVTQQLNGLSVDQVLVGSDGITIPEPTLGALNVPASLASHPALHLPAEHAQRLPGETDTAYADRIVDILTVSGALRVDDGRPIWGGAWGSEPGFPQPSTSSELAEIRDALKGLGAAERTAVIGEIRLPTSKEGEALLHAVLAAHREDVADNARMLGAAVEAVRAGSRENASEVAAAVSAAAAAAAGAAAGAAVSSRQPADRDVQDLAAALESAVGGLRDDLRTGGPRPEVLDTLVAAIEAQTGELGANEARTRQIIEASLGDLAGSIDGTNDNIDAVARRVLAVQSDTADIRHDMEGALSALDTRMDQMQTVLAEVVASTFVGTDFDPGAVEAAIGAAIASQLAQPRAEAQQAVESGDTAGLEAAIATMVDNMTAALRAHDAALDSNTSKMQQVIDSALGAVTRGGAGARPGRVDDERPTFPT
jgi:hypothetical protein